MMIDDEDKELEEEELNLLIHDPIHDLFHGGRQFPFRPTQGTALPNISPHRRGRLASTLYGPHISPPAITAILLRKE